ncbi:hypothetical protein GCM10007895_25630 [Paraferrimonas sedimenticola]|uniref:Uncharacterized protein n=1 Tax=Paraferrimonas sedimenticola TaxID=375674 RepID=A0AA37VYY3_9GAMM|nr:hypothetical protein GCM10007895_25630 [Paraferrimonas sedimenticola]
MLIVATPAGANDELQQIALSLRDRPSAAIAQLQPLQFTSATQEHALKRVHRAILLCEASHTLGGQGQTLAQLEAVRSTLSLIEPYVTAYYRACEAKSNAAQGDLDGAIRLADEAVSVADVADNHGALIYALSTRAHLLVERGLHSEAMHDLGVAKTLVEHQHIEESPLLYPSITDINLGIANLHYYSGDYQQALEYLDSIEIPAQASVSAQTSLNLSRLHFLKALDRRNSVSELAQHLEQNLASVPSDLLRGYVHNGLARAYGYLDEHAKVVMHARAGMVLFEQVAFERPMAMAQLHLGEALLKLNQAEQGLPILEQAASLFASKNWHDSLYQLYQIKADFYLANGQQQKALVALQSMAAVTNAIKQSIDRQRADLSKEEMRNRGLVNAPELELHSVADHIFWLACTLVAGVVFGLLTFWQWPKRSVLRVSTTNAKQILTAVKRGNMRASIVKVQAPMADFDTMNRLIATLRESVRDCDLVYSRWLSRVVIYIPHANQEAAIALQSGLRQRLLERGIDQNISVDVREITAQDTETDILAELDKGQAKAAR